MPGTPEYRPETIIAFDFGLRRIGVAVGQQVTNSASSIGVIANNEDGPDWQSLGRLLSDWQPARLIVGIPSYADGTPSAVTVKAGKFMQDLQRFGTPVESMDENYSSREASDLLREQRAQGLRGRLSKETVDTTAAVLIAERWLNSNVPSAASGKNRPQST